jgi:hypothetical protein
MYLFFRNLQAPPRKFRKKITHYLRVKYRMKQMRQKNFTTTSLIAIIFLLLGSRIVFAHPGISEIRTVTTRVYLPFVTKPLPGVRYDYEINELSYSELPYTYEEPYPLEVDYPTDQDGVIIFNYKGKSYYHPVQIAQKMFRYLDSYVVTKDPAYLERSELFARKLIEISVQADNAMYLPYHFDYNLHGIAEDKMVAPWYSGMAQGQVLTVFVRLYNLTGKAEYRLAAERLFNSFKNLKGEHQPWTVFIDSEGYYWIEEYPWKEPTQALNGFIFGIYGLYDYYLLTHSDESRQLLTASITTVQDYVSEYRNKGGISAYCLQHRWQSPSYHRIHIEQLNMLARISGNDYFWIMSDLFYDDYH